MNLKKVAESRFGRFTNVLLSLHLNECGKYVHITVKRQAT